MRYIPVFSCNTAVGCVSYHDRLVYSYVIPLTNTSLSIAVSLTSTNYFRRGWVIDIRRALHIKRGDHDSPIVV